MVKFMVENGIYLTQDQVIVAIGLIILILATIKLLADRKEYAAMIDNYTDNKIDAYYVSYTHVRDKLDTFATAVIDVAEEDEPQRNEEGLLIPNDKKRFNHWLRSVIENKRQQYGIVIKGYDKISTVKADFKLTNPNQCQPVISSDYLEREAA